MDSKSSLKLMSPVAGQRYGYMSAGGAGYSYITGGGGMILNRAGVDKLLVPPGPLAPCSCPAPDTPDDMLLGRCARRLKLPVLHSGRMFQVGENILSKNQVF